MAPPESSLASSIPGFAATDDPSDFSLPQLRNLDATLRCPICSDLYSSPVTTAVCRHTFCSACVRTAMTSDAREKKQTCPSCSEKLSEVKLVPSPALEAIVDAYKAARPLLLDLSKPPPRRPPYPQANKKRKIDKEISSGAGPSRASAPAKADTVSIDVSDDDDDDDESGPSRKSSSSSSDKGKGKEPMLTEATLQTASSSPVSCPLCSKDVPSKSINDHIDSNCTSFLTFKDKEPVDKWKGFMTKVAKPSAAGSLNGASAIVRKPKPKESYNLLSDKALREKLKNDGLSSEGPSTTLKARHAQWILLWNASCDSAHPALTSELRAQLKEWERARERDAKAVERKKVVAPLDDRTYQKQQRSAFAELEREARRSMLKKRPDPIALTAAPSAATTEGGGSSAPPRALVVKEVKMGAEGETVELNEDEEKKI